MAFTYQNAYKLLHGFNRETERVHAIKFVRECTDFNLVRAKAIVDTAWSNGTVHDLLEQMIAAEALQDTATAVYIPTVVPAPYQDNELAIMNNIFESINGLDSAAKRQRVLQYIISRFGYDVS